MRKKILPTSSIAMPLIPKSLQGEGSSGTMDVGTKDLFTHTHTHTHTHVHSRAETILSGLVLRPFSDDPNSTRMSLMLQTDLKGWIPHFVVNAFAGVVTIPCNH